jgi:hypothetical protein
VEECTKKNTVPNNKYGGSAYQHPPYFAIYTIFAYKTAIQKLTCATKYMGVQQLYACLLPPQSDQLN